MNKFEKNFENYRKFRKNWEISIKNVDFEILRLSYFINMNTDVSKSIIWLNKKHDKKDLKMILR